MTFYIPNIAPGYRINHSKLGPLRWVPTQKVEWLALEFLERTLYPSPAGAPLTTCFIRDGVITEWPYSLSLRGFRMRSCRPFHALVMMKSIHRTGAIPVCIPRQGWPPLSV